LRLSIAVHALALAALMVWPARWPWPLAAILSDHLVILVGVFLPRGRLFGPNLTRLPEPAVSRREVALTFDDGPDPDVTPRILDLLDTHAAKASFFCVGARAEGSPELVGEIIRRGHEVLNHSFGHAHSFPARGLVAMRRDIGRAQAVLTRLTGRTPALFRAPMGFRSPFMEPAIAAHGLHFVSWTRRGFDTRERDAEKVLARLTRGLAAGDILLLHDRGSAVARSGQPIVLEVLPGLLERITASGLHATTLSQGLSQAH